MAKPIIEALKKAYPDLRFIISFFSPSGYNFAEYNNAKDLKIYLPIDIYNAQKQIIEILKPSAVLIIKYEFWYNFMKVLKEKNIPYFYTSLHLEPDSYMFSKHFNKVLDYVKQSERIFCHSKNSLEILQKVGFKNCVTFGDSRIAQVIENKRTDKPVQFKVSKKTICFGSACLNEFNWIVEFINKNSTYNYIIAPHDIDNQSINSLIKGINFHTTLYSKEQKNIASSILIVDTIGDLKHLYKYCNIAYVGGAFKKGPHNLLEPLVYGIPTICGPHVKKFPMAQVMINEGFTQMINKPEDFPNAVKICNNLDVNSFKQKVDFFISHQACKMPLLLDSITEVLKRF